LVFSGASKSESDRQRVDREGNAGRPNENEG